jgi:hypothetical protein
MIRFLNLQVGCINMGKTTGSKAASAASKVLQNRSAGKASKTAAASALIQSKAPGETTSERAAQAASKVLRDGRSSKASKAAAASALAQARPSKKG